MTEGSLKQNDKPMCVRIWLEVGHLCEPRRSAFGRTLPLDWSIWVRGVSGRDISTFVHKVVFYLHPPTAFVYPKRVLQEPPYEIQESGSASIEIPIHVYLKFSEKPKKIRLKYSLQIESISKSSSYSRCVYYDLVNPSEELWQSLMKSGGQAIARAGAFDNQSDKLVVVLAEGERSHRREKNVHKKYKFVKPIKWKHAKRDGKSAIEEICSKYRDSSIVDLKRMLRSVELSEEEAVRVSQLYVLSASYERSAGALVLPPWSDPIYRLPEPRLDYTRTTQ